MTMIICGVDVSGAKLDARIGREGRHLQVARNAEGVAELAAFCRAEGVALAVLEATGGHERLPFALLWAEGIPCALANPRAVRRFAEAMGLLEKTDRIDAGVIAQYATAKELKPQPPASEGHKRLAALTLRLRQVTAARVAQLNQRRLVDDPDALASFDRILACLADEIRILESAVADRSVATLLAFLPEIGTLSNKTVAKLVGLAPIARDSGQRSNRRSVRGGRAPVRSLLVLVAGIVARHEPDFKDAHARLAAAGKPKMVIRVALARKLLVRLNAKARDTRQAFTPA